MSFKIEQINDEKCQLGESPFWDEKSQTLYFVDIFGKSVQRYSPRTKDYVRAVVGEKNVSFIIPVEGQDNTFVIGYGNEVAKLVWDGVSDKIDSLETIAELKNTSERSHRFNDGKADPNGQLWAGVFIPKVGGGFTPNAGSLYALTSNNTLKTLTTDMTLSNGLAWNESINKFYFIDSAAGEIYQFDYKDNEISNREVIFKFSHFNIKGDPDGMTIDTNGNLWIASIGDSKIIQIDPKKPNTLLQTIEMPVKQVTCVVFGGPNYEDLYVTTASISVRNAPAPEGGWTYKITGLGVKGLPPKRVKL
ncbi:regucalcin [Holotrichia oblita]|uniref:Regucalcin n=1 Tax=Holotrichia oblita TaxID=644536 RepID=A0ACB9TGX4_HOLOL|nr:regucalcin [Holotrichia oblita]